MDHPPGPRENLDFPFAVCLTMNELSFIIAHLNRSQSSSQFFLPHQGKKEKEISNIERAQAISKDRANGWKLIGSLEFRGRLGRVSVKKP